MGRSIVLVACLLPAGCKKTPRFCDQDLSGLWLNSSDRHFAYRFRDDGGTVTGEFLQRADDGGTTAPTPPITFDLRRTGDSLAGVMRGSDTTQGGHPCTTEFETRITDCKPDALQVVSETSAPIGEDCKRLTLEDGGAVPRDLTEFHFERAR
jgi:hypothetical protein